MEKEKVELIIKEIINLRLNKGVQPSELIDNISNKEYQEISSFKEGEFVICKVKFTEEDFFTKKLNEIIYIYIYNSNMFLKRIINESDSNIIWDRMKQENDLLKELREFSNNKDLLKDILMSRENEIEFKDCLKEYSA